MEVSLVQEDAVVETVSAKGSPKSFDVRVLPRGFGSCFEGFDAHIFDRLVKSIAEDGVTITQEVFGSGVIGESVSDLLSGPGRGGGVGGVEVKDAAAVMREDDKEEEDAEGGGVDGEEVDGADGFEVIFEESLPGLTGRSAF